MSSPVFTKVFSLLLIHFLDHFLHKGSHDVRLLREEFPLGLGLLGLDGEFRLLVLLAHLLHSELLGLELGVVCRFRLEETAKKNQK